MIWGVLATTEKLSNSSLSRSIVPNLLLEDVPAKFISRVTTVLPVESTVFWVVNPWSFLLLEFTGSPKRAHYSKGAAGILRCIARHLHCDACGNCEVSYCKFT